MSQFKHSKVIVPAGEKMKTFNHYQAIMEQLLGMNLTVILV